jgi:hypothetical protein
MSGYIKTAEQIENHSAAIANRRERVPSYVTDDAPIFVSADSLRVMQDGDVVRLEINSDEKRLVLFVWNDEWPEFQAKIRHMIDREGTEI